MGNVIAALRTVAARAFRSFRIQQGASSHPIDAADEGGPIRGGGGGAGPLERFKPVFPVRHQELFDMYKRAVACFWTVEEVDLKQDVSDWEKMTPNQRRFIKNVLAFFAAADNIVMENLYVFSSDVEITEARFFYGMQMLSETVHSEMYGLLIQTLIPREEQDELFNAVLDMPCVRRKAEWALRWGRSDSPIKQRLVAYACVEGIHFSGSFCAIYWIKTLGLMPGLCFSNELISRDEGLHTDFAVALYRTLPGDPLPEATVHEIVLSALEVEESFIGETLPVGMANMNSALMVQYLRFVADRLCESLGCKAVHGAQNPFDFMNMISIDTKTNFFEARPVEYRRAGVGFADAPLVIDPESVAF